MEADRILGEPPVLDCGSGLILRRHVEGDLAGLVEMGQDAEMQRWTTVPVPYGPGHAEEFLVQVREGWSSGATGATAAFALQLDERFAGNIDLRLEGGSWAEVGYATAPWARGRGVMTRALRTVLEWAFADLQLEGVHWRAHVGNEASRRVAEKCGFTMEGTARGVLLQRGARVDGWLGSMLRAELPRQRTNDS
ncbi:MAG: GNAT family N-acetyltransferase [Acidobacteriota bacterium]|nr:GNAT family N-acetyltransferase [Acidobacteriota bacterium]